MNQASMVTRFGLAVVVALSGLGALSSTPDANADDIPPPPFLVVGTHHIIVGVAWDETVVRKMLPAGIRPAAGATGLINIYTVERGYGITPYQAAYFSVDVEGFDSASGVKGRWILDGVYGPKPVTSAALRKYLDLPIRNGSARIEPTAVGKRAIGTVGDSDILAVDVRSLAKPCDPASVTLNYVSSRGVVEIPVSGEACAAEPVSVDVMSKPGEPFSTLRPTKLLWASEFKNGAFSIARPMPFK